MSAFLYDLFYYRYMQLGLINEYLKHALHLNLLEITIKQLSLFVGPFIVMLSHMVKDLLRFAFLYLEFYLPFGKKIVTFYTVTGISLVFA